MLYRRRTLNGAVRMAPLYAARLPGLHDLGLSDLLITESVCGHTEQLTVILLATAGARLDDKVAILLRSCAVENAVRRVRWDINKMGSRLPSSLRQFEEATG